MVGMNRVQMVGMNRVLLALTLALFASSALLPVSDAAKKPLSAPRKEDVPYIQCQVCEKIASRLHQLVKEKQQQISPKKISEYEIIEIAENVCNLKKEEADWILKIDIVEKGNKLVLVEQEEEGMCNSECKTIEAACQKVIGYSDTDVAEFIYNSKPDLVSLVNHLCKDLTDACSKNPPPVPKDRIPGEPFVAKPSKDAEMDKIMRSMQWLMQHQPSMKQVMSIIAERENSMVTAAAANMSACPPGCQISRGVEHMHHPHMHHHHQQHHRRGRGRRIF